MIQLSYSALSIFKSCPRCFWLDRNKKFTRPQGIRSSFPTGVDNILKKKLGSFRGTLPPALASCPELQGFQLYAGEDLNKMRNWKTNPLMMKDSKGNKIVGAFDDLLFNPTSNLYALLDYKTKGSPADQAYCEKYYQDQMDIYTRFLEIGKLTPANFGVLLYFWPVEAENLIDFVQQAFFLTPNPAHAEQIFKDAIACLEGPMPEAGLDCEYCKYGLMYPRGEAK